ncbi:MAG: histidine phosphatase family protein [Phycisphaerales bacterium]
MPNAPRSTDQDLSSNPMNRRSALALSGALSGAAVFGGFNTLTKASSQPAGSPSGAGAPNEKPLAAFVLRHAEPQGTQSGDPGLSVAGQARADRVGAMLRSVGVSRVLHTHPSRAKETAERIARGCSVGMGSYDAFKPQPLIERLVAGGGVWVIVGHSNTVPGLVKGLGGNPGTDLIPHDQYDDLFMIVRAGGVFSARLRTS